ncbi:hypothetical protein IG631_16843 [Alternaria alternata]|nr:hypothetical protein IG631_16843 [Alternaria alternata]
MPEEPRPQAHAGQAARYAPAAMNLRLHPRGFVISGCVCHALGPNPVSGDGASWSVSCPQAPRHVAFSPCVSASTSIGARDSGITIHFEGEYAPESYTASQPRRHRPRTAPLVRRAYWPAKKCTCSAGRSPLARLAPLEQREPPIAARCSRMSAWI